MEALGFNLDRVVCDTSHAQPGLGPDESGLDRSNVDTLVNAFDAVEAYTGARPSADYLQASGLASITLIAPAALKVWRGP